MRITLMMCFVLLGSFVFAQSEWKLEKDKNDIKIWLADTPGSPYKTFKATTIINADLETTYAYIKDLNKITSYYQGISDVSDIKQLSENEATYFLELEFPWPVKTRRAYVKSKASPVEVGAYEIETVAIPTDSEKEDRVKVTNMSSIWKLVNAGNGKTQVTTIAHMDPAGSIPGWVANAFVVDTPFKSLQNLRRILGK
jgi:hypothetical protein